MVSNKCFLLYRATISGWDWSTIDRGIRQTLAWIYTSHVRALWLDMIPIGAGPSFELYISAIAIMYSMLYVWGLVSAWFGRNILGKPDLRVLCEEHCATRFVTAVILRTGACLVALGWGCYGWGRLISVMDVHKSLLRKWVILAMWFT